MRRWSSHIKCQRFTLYSTIYSTVYRPAKYQRVPCFVLSSLLYFLMPMSIWKIWVDKSKEKSKVSKPNHDVGDGLLGGAGRRRWSSRRRRRVRGHKFQDNHGQISLRVRPGRCSQIWGKIFTQYSNSWQPAEIWINIHKQPYFTDAIECWWHGCEIEDISEKHLTIKSDTG